MNELLNVYNALSTIPVCGVDNCAKMAGSLKILSDLINSIKKEDITLTYNKKEE